MALSGRKFDKVPARLKSPSGVLKPAHINGMQQHHKSDPNPHHHYRHHYHHHHHYYHNQNAGHEKTYGATEQLQQLRCRGKQHPHSKDNEEHKGLKLAGLRQSYIGEFNESSGNENRGNSSSKDEISHDGPYRIPKIDYTKTWRHLSRNVLEKVSFSNNLRDRMKHPKLRGADVYVARLGGTQSLGKRKDAKKARGKNANARDGPLPIAHPPTGSLYDELLCKEPKPSLSKAPAQNSLNKIIDRGNVLESRPCYRCVLYMHSAGIRRVHWTNRDGQWENAKVRDLFDQVSGTNIYDGHNVNNSGVFITKHEILRLRRLSS